MLLSKFFLSTLKETPADAELVSHRLMLRAGLIRKSASGLYAWLPLGYRILTKVENIVRQEMDRAGGLELLLPTVQPAELWQESGRWEHYGKELLRFTDRHERDFCYSPTAEETITDFARRELKSYKELPVNFYQINNKFRDEIRPRFGVMRGREFIMKDAYSFHINEESLMATYRDMYDAYTSIFTKLGLDFRAVWADTGSVGGETSQEFQVLAQSGEDVIAYSDQSDYAANVERAERLVSEERAEPKAQLEKFATPGLRTIEDLATSADVPATRSVKTLLLKGTESPLVALILRGDHELNEIKAAKLPGVASPLEMAEVETIKEVVGCEPGSIGPVDLKLPMFVDHDAANLSDFVCGANQDDFHLRGVNWERDVALGEVVDLRNVVEGDQSPDGKGQLKLARGIEVGQIFALGDKYSKAMNATVLDENGKAVTMQMGCYGIGVSRIVAAAIEQCHDDHGIIWPEAMAPFQVVILPMNMHKSYRVKEAAEKLYTQLQAKGVEVALDDRKLRPGVMFSEADLIGVPHRIVVGEKGLDQGTVEYKRRDQAEAEQVGIEEVLGKF